MPHLALWYWISDNRSRPSSITVRAMNIFELIMGHADDSKYTTLLDEALIAPGALMVGNFLDALQVVLEHGIRAEGDVPTLDTLFSIFRMLDRPLMFPYLRTHGTHTALLQFAATTVRNNTSKTATDHLEAMWTFSVVITRWDLIRLDRLAGRTRCLQNTFPLFRRLMEESRLGSLLLVEGIHGEDIVTLLSSMLDYIARDHSMSSCLLDIIWTLLIPYTQWTTEQGGKVRFASTSRR